jgi:lipopolysaccharide transport system ATP-binding protein
MSAVISVDKLSKKYIIRHQANAPSYLALRDVVSDKVSRLGRRIFSPFLKEQPGPTREEFWALKDISFEVNQGDRVGIIGRNGAGKSTLLKILTRITEPTTGSARIKGRVASLLEVGTGFHPELTGRENIFLNGAILGMGRQEIKKKFDEIVDFAEIEKFLDTPVKRYSSGMYVRLAFAVAAHLEPEILVVDEVLAVGDSQFQKKCLGKMEKVGIEGRTVIFVSHNMATIRQLCNSCMVLSKGGLDYRGDVDGAIDRYLKTFQPLSIANARTLAKNDEFGILLEQYQLLNGNGVPVASAEIGRPAIFDFTVIVRRSYRNCLVALSIDTADDIRVCVLHNAISGYDISLDPKTTRIRCTINRLNLMPGHYLLSFKLRIGTDTVLYLPKAFDFHVENGNFFNTGKLPEKSWGGFCLVDNSWDSLPG